MFLVQGYYSCFFFDRKSPSVPDPYKAINAISEYYKQDSRLLNQTVMDVLERLSKSLPADPDLKGDIRNDKYGYHDGDYWRMILEAERADFVNGYTACRAFYFRESYSRPAKEYMDFVSKHYGIDPDDESVLSEKTGMDKIPPLIVQLKDGARK